MKRVLLSVVFLLCAVGALAQSSQRITTAIMNIPGSNYAQIIQNPSVYVCQYNSGLSCSTPVTIYSDVSLTQPITQPLVGGPTTAQPSQPNGVFQYYIQTGTQVVEKVCAPYNQCSSNAVYIGVGSSGGYVFVSPGTSGQLAQYTGTNTIGGENFASISQGGTGANNLNQALSNLGFAEQNVVSAYNIPSSAANLPSNMTSQPANGLSGHLFFGNGFYITPYNDYYSTPVLFSDFSVDIFGEPRNVWGGFGCDPDWTIPPRGPMLTNLQAAQNIWVTSLSGGTTGSLNSDGSGITLSGGYNAVGDVVNIWTIPPSGPTNVSGLLTITSVATSPLGAITGFSVSNPGSSFNVYSASISAFSGTSGVLTFTTSSQSPALYSGEPITLGGFTGGNSGLNGQQILVLSAGLTTTQFEATVTGSGYASGAGSVTYTGLRVGDFRRSLCMGQDIRSDSSNEYVRNVDGEQWYGDGQHGLDLTTYRAPNNGWMGAYNTVASGLSPQFFIDTGNLQVSRIVQVNSAGTTINPSGLVFPANSAVGGSPGWWIGSPENALIVQNLGINGGAGSGDSIRLGNDENIASFTGSIGPSSTVLNVTAMNYGTIDVGNTITGTGVATNTTITSFGSGSGGVGTYNLSGSAQSVSGETMQAASPSSHYGHITCSNPGTVQVQSFTGTSGTLSFTTDIQNPAFFANGTVILNNFTYPNTGLNGQVVPISSTGVSLTTFQAPVTGTGYSSGSGVAIPSSGSVAPCIINPTLGGRLGVGIQDSNVTQGVFDVATSYVASVGITSFTGTSGTLAFTTNSQSPALIAGQMVSLSSFLSPNTGLNGQQVVVLASPAPTLTSFSAVVVGSGYSGTGPLTATAKWSLSANQNFVVTTDQNQNLVLGNYPDTSYAQGTPTPVRFSAPTLYVTRPGYTSSVGIGFDGSNMAIEAFTDNISSIPATLDVGASGTTTNVEGLLTVNGGSNIVYRCVTAGTKDDVGTLTITSGSCGSTADTGLRVK